MSYILTICIGMTWGLCNQIRTIELPTQAACNAEREALMRFKDVTYATCAPTLLEKKQ